MTDFSRRKFLQAGSGVVVASLVAGKQVVLAQEQPGNVQTSSSSDRVRFASIGVGIQGSSLLRAAVTLPQAECIAACDLYDGRHTLVREIAGPNIKTTRRYQEILDDKNIECVIVAVLITGTSKSPSRRLAQAKTFMSRSRCRTRSPKVKRWCAP